MRPAETVIFEQAVGVADEIPVSEEEQLDEIERLGIVLEWARGRAACRGADRRPGGQGLPLNRTMLSNHGLPYVGRFACDWHRLAPDQLRRTGLLRNHGPQWAP